MVNLFLLWQQIRPAKKKGIQTSYYEDNLSKWYISENGNFSTFMNQLKDEKLKEQAVTVLDSKRIDPNFDTRFKFQVEYFDDDGSTIGTGEETFSVWKDQNENKHKVYRKTPPESLKKSLGITSTSSNSNNPPSSGSGSSSNYNSGNKFTGERGWFDSKSKKLVTWEVWESFSNDFSMRLLTPKDVQPTNYLLQINGKEVLKVWIGKWMKPKE